MENFFIQDFLIIPSKNLIRKTTTDIPVTPKMMAVLCSLAINSNQTVSKQTLLDQVWGNVRVSELVLSRAIADLRKALGESAKEARLITTVSKKGYCLNADIRYQKTNPSDVQHSDPVKWVKWFLVVSLIGVLSYQLLTPEVVQINSRVSQPKYITTGLNHEVNPRFSRDGKLIAYVEDFKVGHSRLVLFQQAGDKYTELLSGDFVIRSPAFSPDSRKLVFFRLQKGLCEISVFEIDTRQITNIASCPYATSKSLDWSPTSDQILTTVFDKESAVEGIVIIDIDTTKVNRFSFPEQKQSGYLFPRYSDDGNSIVALFYLPTANLWEVRLFDISSKQISRVVRENNFINQVVWGSDNKEVFYGVTGGDRAGIWRYSLIDHSKKLIENSEVVDLDFSASNTQFVYVRENRQLNVWSYELDMNSNPAHFRQSFSSKIDRQPAVSLDNRYLAFVSDRNNAFNLWVKDLHTGKEKQWTEFDAGVITDPIWSSQGKLYFTYTIDDKSDVFEMHQPFKFKNVFSNKHNYQAREISRDDKRIYFTSDLDGSWKTYRKGLLSAELEVIVDYPVEILKELASGIYFKRYSDAGISKVSHSRPLGKETQLTFDNTYFQGVWDAVNESIYYIEPIEYKTANIMKLNLITGESQMVTQFPATYSWKNLGFSVSENEQHIFYTRLEHSSRDIILIER